MVAQSASEQALCGASASGSKRSPRTEDMPGPRCSGPSLTHNNPVQATSSLSLRSSAAAAYLHRYVSLARYVLRIIVLVAPIYGVARADPDISTPLASLETYRQCLSDTANVSQFFSYVDVSLDEYCATYQEAREQWIRDESPTVYVHANACETYGISGASPDSCLPVSFAGAATVQIVTDGAADTGLVQGIVAGIRARGVKTMVLKGVSPE